MIKSISIQLLALVLLSGYVSAQDTIKDHHCTTVQYNNTLEEKFPEIKANRSRLEEKIRQYVVAHRGDQKQIITIPTVVHVVWNTPEQNIPDEQVWSQIIVLNQDFRRLNIDSIYTPAMFKPFAADCQIEFCLARRAPQDTADTYGIVRVHTDTLEFGLDNSVKFPYKGGSRAWDPEKYLNIWVCNIAGNFLGYAQYPGGPDSTDGVVIDYKCFGSVGNLNPHYNKGRTATHEIGHWLDLYHIWGDDYGSCEGTDYVDDTPNAADANYFCQTHPHTTVCNNTGEMFMNYMDYSDDFCFNLFTKGQRDRMLAAINTVRTGLLTSDGCVPYDGINEIHQDINLNLYPNPVGEYFTLQTTLPFPASLHITLTDVLGKIVYENITLKQSEFHLPIDVSNQKNGIYFIHVQADKLIGSAKLIVLH